MVIVAALLLSASSTAAPHSVAERQATVMVRIPSGAPLRFAQLEKTAPERFTNAHIRGSDGSSQPARLVEFH